MGVDNLKTHFQHTKEQPVLAKFICTFRKVYPSVFWLKKKKIPSRRLPGSEQASTVLPMTRRCGIFTGAATAGLYISFAEEGMITAAI